MHCGLRSADCRLKGKKPNSCAGGGRNPGAGKLPKWHSASGIRGPRPVARRSRPAARGPWPAARGPWPAARGPQLATAFAYSRRRSTRVPQARLKVATRREPVETGATGPPSLSSQAPAGALESPFSRP
jgi:hypothetical protein